MINPHLEIMKSLGPIVDLVVTQRKKRRLWGKPKNELERELQIELRKLHQLIVGDENE